MTKAEVYTTAIKIFGLYFLTLFIQDALEFAFFMIGSITTESFTNGWYIYGGILAKTLVDFAVFFVATLKTNFITDRFFTSDNTNIELTLVKSDWLELAIAIIGIVVIVYSIPSLFNFVVGSIYFRTNPEEFGSTNEKAPIFLNGFKFIVGIFTILNARNLAKFIVKRGESDDNLDSEKER